MYFANARASLPVSIVLPATFSVGSLIEAGSPACLASALIALAFMYGLPAPAYDWPRMDTARETDRLRTLLETGIAITSELSLEAVLERIVEAAASLTGARYAALGVIDRSGAALERFVVTGFDDETIRAIGDPPHDPGILGVLICEAEP